jgi:hypothetical protein
MIALQVPPAWIPAWSGREPLRYCIDASATSYAPEIRYAFWTWKQLITLPAYEWGDCTAARTITYRAAPIGPWGLGFFPHPFYPEPIAGDVYLNSGIPWLEHPGARQYLLPVLLHETGHAFGLPESGLPEDLMNPNVQPNRFYPSPNEVRRIRCLYDNVCQ